MKLVLNNQVIKRLNEEFPSLSKNQFERRDSDEPLRAYFNDYEKDYRYIISLESLKNDENIHDYDFFENIFNVCNILLNKDDYDQYLKELFNDEYELIAVNSTILSIKYDLKTLETIFGLKKILLAVKKGYDFDENHTYTPNDIMLLQNQNIVRYIGNVCNYKNISGEEYQKLKWKYRGRKLIPMGIYEINKLNYFNLLNQYPHLFSYIRNNISFEMISEFILEYEELFSSVINKEIDDCNKMICKSLKRIDDIKKYN